MLSTIATLIGLPKWAVIAGLVALSVLGLGLGKCAYDRRIINAHETKQELKQVKRERKADANLQINQDRDEAAAQQRREEMNDATHSIPDQAPSARQKAITCLELKRQGVKLPAACLP